MNRIFELRQYTLKPGRRDDLIALFERELIETQEAVGMDVFGPFRDADDADRFVWLRGFPDMERRATSLAAFYGGPVWKTHRNAANDTMIDSDNVLLLKPAWDGAGLAALAERTPRGAAVLPKGIVTASVCYFAGDVPDAFVTSFRALNTPGLIAAFVTEDSENTFPALPVRAGEHVFVWLSLCADHVNAAALPADLLQFCVSPVETLHLLPTARSNIHA